MPGTDFLLPGVVGTGWGRAELWEAGWFTYSQRASPHLSQMSGSALQPGEQCWPQIYELSFLFLFANQEQFLMLRFSNPFSLQLLFPPVVFVLLRHRMLELLRSLPQLQVCL